MVKKFQPPTQKTINGQTALNKGQAKKASKKLDSEYQSYTYIKNELKDLGWNVGNPNRDVNGQLYTQREYTGNLELASILGGKIPEYIVKLNEDAFWVIEAKSSHDDIDIAFEEAKEYGWRTNQHKFLRAILVSGIAGNDVDRYLVKTAFWEDDKKEFTPVTYNEKEITNLLSPELAEKLLHQKSPHLKDLEINEEEYIKIAERINEVFQEASIKKDIRAGIIASILLSLLSETEPNYNAPPTTLIKDINSRAQEVLDQNQKGQFFEHIKIRLPEKENAQKQFKEALVTAFFLLKTKANIKSAMKAGSDILGTFYENFLRYGNGAKDLGILLTPRHITQFVSEVLNVTHKDIVYDPTCGTGGFLVSAFNQVSKNSTSEQLNGFKQHGIFGIDKQAPVTALAIVNMIFRGDGKNHIINDDSLSTALVTEMDGRPSARFVTKKEGLEHTERPVTKVLMNPPFGQPSDRETEYKFIDHALDQMEEGGILFSVLPVSVMFKVGKEKNWRERLLSKNTLISVITFPPDLFYQSDSSVQTIGIFLKKGIPHAGQKVLWIRAINDGLVKRKGKRVSNPRVPNDLNSIKNSLQSYIQNQQIPIENIREFQKATSIDLSDPESHLELVPEAYLDEKSPSISEIEEGLLKIVREGVAYLIKSGTVSLSEPFPEHNTIPFASHNTNYGFFNVEEDLFALDRGDFHALDRLDEGVIPTVSRISDDNGVVGYFEPPEGAQLRQKGLLTVSTVTGDAFVQLTDFMATDNVLICYPKKPLRLTTIFFIQLMINLQRWRFSYGRQPYRRIFSSINIPLPIKDGEIDEDYIETVVKNSYGWNIVERQLLAE